jgi:hypothetical protein
MKQKTPTRYRALTAFAFTSENGERRVIREGEELREHDEAVATRPGNFVASDDLLESEFREAVTAFKLEGQERRAEQIRQREAEQAEQRARDRARIAALADELEVKQARQREATLRQHAEHHRRQQEKAAEQAAKSEQQRAVLRDHDRAMMEVERRQLRETPRTPS